MPKLSPLAPEIQLGRSDTKGSVQEALFERPELDINVRREISPESLNALLSGIKIRFMLNMRRHPKLDWDYVQHRFTNLATPEQQWAVAKMDKDQGEPDIVDIINGKLLIIECSKESPRRRLGMLYDSKAEQRHRIHSPKCTPHGNILSLANWMKVKPLWPDDYMRLQSLGEFDPTSFTWIRTPKELRRKNTALSGSRDETGPHIIPVKADNSYSERGVRYKIII